MAGERVLDRFDSFDLGKQNTTHIFRLSTFASSRHNYTLIVLANILQRSMKSPGALAAATAASDFMRFLAYFTNLPRSARSRKRIKKKCQRGNRRNQVEHPVTFSKLKPPHQYYGFPWLVLSVGDMKLWCSKFNANVLEVGQNHIHIYHTRILRTHIRCLHIMQNQMATDDIEWQWKCNQQCLPVACQNETEPEEQKRQSASGFSRHLTAGDKRQMKQTLESHDKQEKKCHTPPSAVTKNYVQPTFITLSSLSFLMMVVVENVFLARKAKVCDMCKLLEFFLVPNFIGFQQEKWQKKFRNVICQLNITSRLKFPSKCNIYIYIS